MQGALSIPLVCYRNALFAVPLSVFYPNQQGPISLAGMAPEFLIGAQGVAPVATPSGAPAYWDIPGGLPGWHDGWSAAPYPAAAALQWHPLPGTTPWWEMFGTVVMGDNAPAGNLALGAITFHLPATATAYLTAGARYNWMVLVKPAGLDPSPLCGGPLLVRDAPAYQ